MSNYKPTFEETALKWLRDLGYSIVYGNDIMSENMLASLRDSLSLLMVDTREARVKWIL